MTRSTSAEPGSKNSSSSKRKGTRSVSTLTPSQLARKRANDREAQRAIRARTKEHIENLERQLEELKSHQSRDKAVQDLMRRNRALEDELARLRESMGISITSSPYSAPAGIYDDTGSAGSGTIPSPRMSPLVSSADYSSYTNSHSHQQYVATMGADAWAANALHSNVSSPSSTGNHADDYAAGYIPTSVPTTMMGSATAIHAMDNKSLKMEFDDVDGFRMANVSSMSHSMSPAGAQYLDQHSQHSHQQHQHQHQQNADAWGMYGR